jgi:hypothetical protein
MRPLPRPLGRLRWAVPGVHIPVRSTGLEPEFTSRDQLAVLNTNDRPAEVTLRVFQTDGEPLGPYRFQVAARRVRVVRFNDLIDPQALLLGTDYAALIDSDVPVVVQFTRQDTRQAANAICGAIASPA